MGGAHTILVVEQEPEIGARLAVVLRGECDVEVASSGAEALDRLRTDRYDLVLLGSIGVGRENEALLSDLASRARRPKVILIAPAFSSAVLEQAAVLGADGVLESRDEEEVGAAVAAHLA